MKLYSLVILDRDGTLNFEDYRFHKNLELVRSYPFTQLALRRLAGAGLKLAVATNQSGIARGYWTQSAVEELHTRLTKIWGVNLSFHICPHGPDDGCECRKPLPSMLLEALDYHHIKPDEAIFAGDSIKDAESAQAAGVDFALVLTGRGHQSRSDLNIRDNMVFNNIAVLAERIAADAGR